MHSRTHACTRARTHAHTHARTRAHTPPHTHTHTHTQFQTKIQAIKRPNKQIKDDPLFADETIHHWFWGLRLCEVMKNKTKKQRNVLLGSISILHSFISYKDEGIDAIDNYTLFCPL